METQLLLRLSPFYLLIYLFWQLAAITASQFKIKDQKVELLSKNIFKNVSSHSSPWFPIFPQGRNERLEYSMFSTVLMNACLQTSAVTCWPWWMLFHGFETMYTHICWFGRVMNDLNVIGNCGLTALLSDMSVFVNRVVCFTSAILCLEREGGSSCKANNKVIWRSTHAYTCELGIV